MTDQINHTEDMIFVFGSNLGGYHGGGAARYALEHRGAVWGQHLGRQGQSWAIPTKGKTTRDDKRSGIGSTLTLREIKSYVDDFLRDARDHPELAYQVTRIGCGLAGLQDKDIAPLFINEDLGNLWFDTAWEPYLGPLYKYWGTHP